MLVLAPLSRVYRSLTVHVDPAVLNQNCDDVGVHWPVKSHACCGLCSRPTAPSTARMIARTAPATNSFSSVGVSRYTPPAFSCGAPKPLAADLSAEPIDADIWRPKPLAADLSAEPIVVDVLGPRLLCGDLSCGPSTPSSDVLSSDGLSAPFVSLALMTAMTMPITTTSTMPATIMPIKSRPDTVAVAVCVALCDTSVVTLCRFVEVET